MCLQLFVFESIVLYSDTKRPETLIFFISFFSHLRIKCIIRDKKSSATRTLSRSSHGGLSFPLFQLYHALCLLSFPPFSMLYFAATWPPPNGRNAGNVNIYTSGSQFRAVLYHFWHARRPHKFNELIFYGSIRDESGTWKRKKKNVFLLQSSGNESFRRNSAFSRIVSGTRTVSRMFFYSTEVT